MPETRLLVVEDDADIVVLISKIASQMGFEISTTSGSGVRTAYQRTRPHIIVLDIMMPEMDGLEVLQYLREQGSKAHIIILSGSQESYRRIAQNMGLGAGLTIEANVSKPFRAADLRLALEKARRLLGASAPEIKPASV